MCLTKPQGTAALVVDFTVAGEGLPVTATEGLRYTPVPVVPYLQVIAG